MREFWDFLVEERGNLYSFLGCVLSLIFSIILDNNGKRLAKNIAIGLTVLFFLLGVSLTWSGYIAQKGEEITEPVASEIGADFEQQFIQSTLDTSSAYASDQQYRLAIKSIYDARAVYDCEAFNDVLIDIQRSYSLHRIAAGRRFSALINSDGTVSICGSSEMGPCNTSGWRNIISVEVGDYYILGLTEAGTVVATGPTEYYTGVEDWTNITMISAGDSHCVGLAADGTLYAAGKNDYGQLNVNELYGPSPIVSVAAGYRRTVVLYADGTVKAIGRKDGGRCDMSDWVNIVSIAAGSEHTLGLTAEGKVKSTGDNEFGQCRTTGEGWCNIDIISAGDYFSMGLQSGGTVVATGQNTSYQCEVNDWENITAIAAGNAQALGLCSNGTIKCAGKQSLGLFS